MADDDDLPELGISLDTVCWLISRARAFDAKEAGDGDTDADLVIALMEDLRESGVGYLVLLTKGVGMEGA